MRWNTFGWLRIASGETIFNQLETPTKMILVLKDWLVFSQGWLWIARFTCSCQNMLIIQVYGIAPTNNATDEEEKRLFTITLNQYMIQHQDVMSLVWLCATLEKNWL